MQEQIHIPKASPQKIKQIILSCLVGNWLEWYEFAIFGFLSKQISQNFFPSTDPRLAILMTYGIFATGFIMRPIGAILSGYLGDQHGRKTGLLVSIVLMAIPTFCMGILPTYDQAGIIAPLLLLLCRMLQGVSLGGEFSGSIVYLIEHAPKNRQALFGLGADFGSSLGMISATLTIMILTTCLTSDELLTWGWRLPFLFGLLFGGVCYYVRRNLEESPQFKNLAPNTRVKNPLKVSLTDNPKKFILSIFFLALNSAGYYFLVIYLPQQVGQGDNQYLLTLLPLVSLVAMIPAYFLGAYLADRFGQTPCLIAGCLMAITLVIPLIYATHHMDVIWKCVFHGLFAWSLGLCFGPRSSFMVQLWPVKIRCTAISLSYNLANAFFGGLSPLICLSFVGYFQTPYGAGFWILGSALISLVSVISLSKIKKTYEAQDELLIQKAA